MNETPRDDRWSSAWPDLLAFACGLAVAWWGHWRASDLVWSLWLSSLVVGYAMILWGIARPVVDFLQQAGRAPAALPMIAEAGWKKIAAVVALALFFGLFIVAFFTVHFGGFHYVHSMILSYFFPVEVNGTRLAAGLPILEEVARRYWIFLPSAFLAQRAVFMRRTPVEVDRSVTAAAIAARKMRNSSALSTPMTEPYRKVIRMHLLIFFFAAAHFAKLDNFAVYAVVYAVYFFPWRLLQSRQGTPMVATGS